MPKAFPSAFGFGAESISGGREGTVYFIDNLNDSGSGSARAAFTASGARHIIPRVAGIVDLSTSLNITQPNFTYHGHLAPGGGLMFRHRSVQVQHSNGIIRFMKSFPGGGALSSTPMQALHVVNGTTMHGVIADHCNIGWSSDEQAGGYGNYQDVIYQWCMIVEGRDTKGDGSAGNNFGPLFSNSVYSGNVQRWTMHNCLLAFNKSRNPQVQPRPSASGGPFGAPGCQGQFYNNVVNWWNGNAYSVFRSDHNNADRYNDWITEFGSSAVGLEMNVIGNHWIKGPLGVSENGVAWVTPHVKAYFANNIGPASASPVDGFDVQVNHQSIRYQGDSNTLTLYGSGGWEAAVADNIQATPFAFPSIPLIDATGVFDRIMDRVGATLPIKDTLHQRIINDVIEQNGSFGDKSDYPTLASGDYPTHSQPDGIPDAWKTANGLDTGTDYTGVLAPSGYDWVEVYSHEVAGDLPLWVQDGTLRYTEPATHTKSRVFVSWSNRERWFDAENSARGTKADGTGFANDLTKWPFGNRPENFSVAVRHDDGESEGEKSDPIDVHLPEA